MSGVFGDSTVIANRFSKMYVNGFVDVSYGNVLLRGDAGANHLILQNGDISLNGRLFSTRDISLNGNLNIGGNLSVSQFSSNKTITTTNYQLVVSEDISLNGRLFVSNNVGIGTTNPQAALDVTTGVKINSASNNTLIVNSSTLSGYNTGAWVGTTGAGLQIGWNSVLSGFGTTDFLCAGQAGSGGFSFSTTTSGSPSIATHMVIKPGNVGIGTTNPQYTLDVSSVSTQPFRVGVGSTNALVVNTVGNVGIGTTNPQSALDVTGAIRVSGGITPTYSSPSFGPGQVGSIITLSGNNGAMSVGISYTNYLLTTGTTTINAGVYSYSATIYGYANIWVSGTLGLCANTSFGGRVDSPVSINGGWFSGGNINTAITNNGYITIPSTAAYYLYCNIGANSSGTINCGGCAMWLMRIA